MNIIENSNGIYESQMDNIKEIDLVQKQVTNELSQLQQGMFYEKKEDKVVYNMNNVKKYLEGKSGKSREDLKKSGFYTYIMAVQIGLESLGYDLGNIDGLLRDYNKKTSKTMDAVNKFQKDNNLKEDGLPGPKTLKVLLEKLNQNITEDTPTVDTPTEDTPTVDTPAEDTPTVEPEKASEITSLKNKLLSKENMTSSDKENMNICIDMILDSEDIISVNEKYIGKPQIDLLRGLDDNIKYGNNYIEIGGIKYNREPIVKDGEGHPKLITGNEYVQALNKQNVKGITVHDIQKSCGSLPSSIMLGVLLGVYFDGIPNLRDDNGNDATVENNGVRSFLIGTTDKNNKGDYQGYYMQIQEVRNSEDEANTDTTRVPHMGPMGSIAISEFSPEAKFFGFYKI